MASCAITIGGSSGEVRIDFTLEAQRHSMNGFPDETLYINDDSTDITYTTLSGNATAISGCITITERNYINYIFSWETFGVETGYKLADVIVDDDTISLNTNYKTTMWITVANAITAMEDERFMVTAGKQVSNASRNSISHYIVVKVLGTDVPQIVVENTTPEHSFILTGVEEDDEVPSGYTAYTP